MFATACFNVEKVDITSTSRERLIIDDFEDGDLFPTSRLFKAWFCYAYVGVPNQPSCYITSGFESNYAYALKFEDQSPSDPSAYGVGDGVGISPPVGTVDISTYQAVHFDAKMESGSPPPPSGTVCEIGIICDSVDHPPGSVSGGFSETHEFKPTGDWQSYTFALSDFTQPGWQQVRISDKNQCPKLVDTLNFNISLALTNGQSAGGTLAIDNVWLE